MYLTGSENTIRRVTAETNYSCLMLKTQRFSSLFRHYAKYHGLRKDDLEYYFVNPLENEDTPESVQLQRGDTIMVRKRRKPDPPEPAADDEEFFKDMIDLLDDEEHMDAIFLIHNNNNNNNSTTVKTPNSMAAQMICSRMAMIATTSSGSSSSSHIESNTTSGNVICVKKEDFATHEEEEDHHTTTMMEEDGIQIRAHKCILTARSEYFKALFRKSAGGGEDKKLSFREAAGSVIHVDPSFAASTVQMMLEFLYTNRVRSLTSVSTDDLLKLLHLSDMYSLRDLKRLVEHELIRSHMDVNTVARMYCATEDYNANRLSQACIDFIMENIREVTGNVEFQEEMKHYPHLCIPVLKAAADLIPEPVHKKQRTDNHNSNNNNNNPNSGNSNAGCSSSPVPDSDA